MEFILNNLAEALMILGVIALIIEVAVLGMSTYVLLFLGLSLFVSGLLMSFGLLSSDITTAVWTNIVFTAGFAALLWQPLKRMQEKTDSKKVHSDFAELVITLEQDINEQSTVTYQYSGIQWQLKSTQPIAAGTQVKVVDKQVGVLWVEAL